MAAALRRVHEEAPDKALGPMVAFGLGAAAGAVSAVSDKVFLPFYAVATALNVFNPFSRRDGRQPMGESLRKTSRKWRNLHWVCESQRRSWC